MKYLPTLLMFVMTVKSFAAFHEGTIVYKNGRSRTGLIEAKLGEVVRFKPWAEAEEEKISASGLKSVLLKTDSGRQQREYFFMNVYAGVGQKKVSAEPVWLKQVEKGRVSLFVRESVSHGHDGIDKFSLNEFYCLREGEQHATHVADFESNHTFKSNGALYFSDYTELADKIKSKQYASENIQEVVKAYNQWLAGKSA